MPDHALLVVRPAEPAAQPFDAAGVAHDVDHRAEHEFIGPPDFPFRPPWQSRSERLDHGAGDRVEHVANEAPLLRTRVHRLVRENPTEARIPIMGAQMQHRKDERLDDKLEPPVEVGLAHRDRETGQTLLHHRRHTPVEHCAIKPSFDPKW